MSKIICKKNESLQLKGHYKFEFIDPETGAIQKVVEVENLIPTVCKNAIAEQIANDNTQELSATYMALGSNNAAPTTGDTTLGTETFRKLIAVDTSSGAVATLTGSFSTGEANGTHKEIGVFGNGASLAATGSADTGILFSRASVDITKTSSSILNVSYIFTIS